MTSISDSDDKTTMMIIGIPSPQLYNARREEIQMCIDAWENYGKEEKK